MKRFTSPLIAGLLVLLMVAPVAAQETVSLWFHSGQGGERDELDRQITAFNEMQSDYVIAPLEVPEGSYND